MGYDNQADSILAGSGNDTILASFGNDTIDGGDGTDLYDSSHLSQNTIVDLNGGASSYVGTSSTNLSITNVENVNTGGGDDSITGNSANNVINSGDGNDTINGGAGSDSINSGAGHDRIDTGQENSIVNDTVQAGSGNDTVIGSFGNDVLDGGAGIDTYDQGNRGGAVNINLNSETASVGGTQTITNFENATGGFGSDTITGSDGANVLIGDGPSVASGNDSIWARAGNDTIEGGAGDDYVNAGADDDSVLGGAGNDSIIGEAGNDTLKGGTGNDTLHGGDGADTLDGGSGDDSITGGLGNDSIIGYEGNDTVDGGYGDDYINTRTSTGTGTPDTGVAYPDDPSTGIDESALYSYAGDTDPNNDRDSVAGGAGNDTILTGDDNDTITGGDGHDSIDAGFDDDSVTADGGNDTIEGSEGADSIDGGAGDDVIYGGLSPANPNYAVQSVYELDNDGSTTSADPAPSNNADSLSGGVGNDSIYGDDDNDTLYGGDGNDYLDGGIDDDRLYGNAGDDTMLGGSGDDYLRGGDGNDSLTGGSGDDHFRIYETSGVGSGHDTITDFGTGTTGPIDDNNFFNNDYVNLAGFYNQANYDAAVAAGDIDSSVIKNPLQWMRADQADDGVLNDTNAGWDANNSLTIQNGGAAAPASGLTYDTTNVLCFAKGTLIKTIQGDVPVEELSQGDMVLTRDHGFQPLRWIGSNPVSQAVLAAHENLYPVRIRAGALGSGLPEQDLVVSPQHRILVSSKIVKRMFEGEDEVLVAAKQLVMIDGIDIAYDIESVEYFHFLFEQHEIVFSNGAETESLYTGPEALKSLTPEARSEIQTLFPELLSMDYTATSARRIIKGRKGRQLAVRHKNKNKPLLELF